MEEMVTDAENSAFKADALRALVGHRELEALLKPPEFDEAGRQVFNKANCPLEKEELLSLFHWLEEPYASLPPAGQVWPKWKRDIAEEVFERKLDTSVAVSIGIPRKLLDAQTPTRLKIAVRWHGGGGVRFVGIMQ
jgi:hypothetical protein